MTSPTPPDSFIDKRLPAPWILTTAFAAVMAMAGLYYQVGGLVESSKAMAAKIDTRDERFNVLVQTLTLQQGKDALQDSTISRLSSDVTDIKRDVDNIKDKTRWTPGK